MSALGRLVRGKRGVATALGLAVVVAVPVIIAISHRGFPVTTADLDARTVWVSNQKDALAGRLNRPIQELDGAVHPKSGDFEVLQDGTTVVLHDVLNSTIASVNPAFNTFVGESKVPPNTTASLGNGVIALSQVATGDVWVIGPAQPFDPKAPPALRLGKGGTAVVGVDGEVAAYSPSRQRIYTIRSPGEKPQATGVSGPKGTSQVTMVGSHVVVLGEKSKTLVVGGSSVTLPVAGYRLQQPGADSSSVLVSTASSLLEVPLDGGRPVSLDADLASPSTSVTDAAAPVLLNGCVYAAWSTSRRELQRCADGVTVKNTIPQATNGQELQFRVNRSVIVLNNIEDGDSWLLGPRLIRVNNWKDVEPRVADKQSLGEKDSSDDSFEDEIAKRTTENHPPIARDDSFGARQEQATVLPVLDNDTDPDGDVLTITNVTPIAASQGTMVTIDEGRALQFTSSHGAVGSVSARYTVSDGRPGGVAEATVTIAITPDSTNRAPVQQRVTSISVEQGQSISYNVLPDWTDPDGDEIYLKSASSASGDVVRHTPDGLVNFTHTTAEIGQKVITVVVSDDRQKSTVGKLIVNVREKGSLTPVGTPDFATTTVGTPVTIKPLANDVSPSGDPLAILSVTPYDTSTTAIAVPATGEVIFTSPKVGAYYLKYTVTAGSKASEGLIRVDVAAASNSPKPPIAVRDVAYLRPAQSVDLAVLQNDVSPSGRVIGIESVDVPVTDTTVTVEMLKNTLLRVSSSAALSKPVTFTYTISDGVGTAVASVVVIPVPPLVNNQPPIAKDDAATVRAGDAISVAVLDNDIQPDGAVMHVSPTFSVPLPADQGFAFVTADEVRYQAPQTPGIYSVSYVDVDAAQQLGSAKVVFTVTPASAKQNKPPVPQDLTARVFAGSTILLDIPLDGIDPDGDSTTLVGVTSSPTKGRIIDQNDTSLRYEAYPTSAGTDEFTYQVKDVTGATGQAKIRIAVLPRPTDAQAPSAVEDHIALRPNHTASVPVLANDSDPSGFALALESHLVVPKGISARVVGTQVLVSATAKGHFVIGYEITNGHGGTAHGFITITVAADAPLLPPVAIDQTVDSKDVVGKQTVDVDVHKGAENPAGAVANLKVGLVGPDAQFAEVLPNGKVRVRLGDSRRVVAYTLTSADKLTATAFVIVPRKVGSDYAPPPFLKTDLPEQVVQSGVLHTWRLADILTVPSRRAPHLVGAQFISGSKGVAGSFYVDRSTLGFKSIPGYSGPASVTFLVTDAPTAKDPNGNQGYVTLPITVKDSAQPASIAPVFTTRTLDVVAHDSATLDLRAATDHPSAEVKSELQYGGLTGGTSAIDAHISDGVLTVSAADGTSRGTTASLSFTISGGGVPSVTAHVLVLVVSSPLPLAQVQDDVILTQRPKTETVSPLVNDGNPFGPDKPLTIVKAAVEDNGAELGGPVTHTDSTVTVVPRSDFVGTISVLYTVKDYTGDKDREVSARIRYVYRDVPSNNESVGGIATSSHTIVLTINSAPTDNGAPIDGYRGTVGTTTQACSFNVPCTFGGLPNGQRYDISLEAHNELGWGASESWGAALIAGPVPLGTASMNSSYDRVGLYWSQPVGDSGGLDHVNWRMIAGSGESATVSPSTTSAVLPKRTTTDPVGPYQFEEQGCNLLDQCGPWAVSNQVNLESTPTGFRVTKISALTTYTDPSTGHVYAGYYLQASWASIAPGGYEFCGSTDGSILWTKYSDVSPSGRQCASGTVASDGNGGGTIRPFGWFAVEGGSHTGSVDLPMSTGGYVFPPTGFTVP